MYHTYIFLKNIFSLEVSVLSDIKPFRNLTFYNVLAQQGSLFCKLLHRVTLNGSPRKLSRRSKDELSLKVLLTEQCLR